MDPYPYDGTFLQTMNDAQRSSISTEEVLRSEALIAAKFIAGN
jgi:hypothetical protein